MSLSNSTGVSAPPREERNKDDVDYDYGTLKRAICVLTILVLFLYPVLVCSWRLYASASSVIQRQSQEHDMQRRASSYRRLLAAQGIFEKWTIRLMSTAAQMLICKIVAALSTLSVLTMMMQLVSVLALAVFNKEGNSSIGLAYTAGFLELSIGFMFALQCGLLLWCYTTRLITTFEESASVRVEHKAAQRVLAYIIFCAIAFFTGLIIWILTDNPLIAIACSSLIFLGYVVICAWLMATFLSRVMLVARSSAAENDDSEAARREGNLNFCLADTALRVTVCAFLALMTNCFVVIFAFTYILSGCPSCAMTLYVMDCVVFAVDKITNAFCLECSFQDGTQYYLNVLGCLHIRLLNKLTSSVIHRVTSKEP